MTDTAKELEGLASDGGRIYGLERDILRRAAAELRELQADLHWLGENAPEIHSWANDEGSFWGLDDYPSGQTFRGAIRNARASQEGEGTQ